MRNYLAGSVAAAIVVIWHAFATRHQFFPSVVYLSSSKLSVAVLGNLGFALALSTYKLLTWTFLGRLRDSEVERINDKVSQAIIETLLAMTIFRQDFTVGFFAAFVILSFVKIFHWMIQDRVDFIETTPNVSRSQHIRIVAFICLLIGIDYTLLHYALASTLSKGVSINLLFAFEYAIQISTALTTLCKYTLSVIDMAMEGRWEGKGVAVFYLELALDLLHLITYTAFFAAVFTTYGIPIHLVRDLYWTFRNFQTRVRDFLRYRQVAAIMEHRFPDATAEDLTRADHVCIVCREDMGPGSRAKRLDCSHSFHVHCLRSWLERQQNCPICRAPVLASVPPTAAAARRNRPGAGGAANVVGNVGGGAPGGAENNNNNINRPAAGGAQHDGAAAAAAGGVGVAGADGAHNDRMFDLHALLGLDDEFMDGMGGGAGQGGPLPAGGRQEGGAAAAAAGTGLRWRGPQQPQQNGNAPAAGGGGAPPMQPFMQYPMHQQQYPYGYYAPQPFAFPQQQWHWPMPMPPQQQQPQQQMAPPGVTSNAAGAPERDAYGELNDRQGNPAAAAGTTSTGATASPLPQQQQAENFTSAQNQAEQPAMMPSFFPIPVFIPMMASPGPYTPGGHHEQQQQQQQQQQQHVTPEQHAMAAALAAAATAAASMSAPFMMTSPPPQPSGGYSPMPMSSQEPGSSSNGEPSLSTTPPPAPIVKEQQQEQQRQEVGEQSQAAPPQEKPANNSAGTSPAPVPTTASTNTSTPAPAVADDGDDEAAQIRRRRLERFQNANGGASRSGGSNL